jgi:hypothetical protein
VIAPREAAGWKKKHLVSELLRVRLEVLMRRAAGGRRGWVPVSWEEEEGGVVVVRRPVLVVVGGEGDVV